MAAKNATKEDIRLAAERDLETFIRLVAPYQVLGGVHQELCDWWTRSGAKTHQLTLLPRDHGKALSLDSEVLLADGNWKKVQEVSVGDWLVGSDGKPNRVVQLHPIDDMELYELTTRDGRKVVCNKDHLWTVQCPSNTGDRWVTKTTEEILQNYKSERFDKRNGKVYTEHRYFLPTVKPIEFPEADLPIDPYVLGVWLGDGHSNGGTVSSADPEIFEHFPSDYRITKHASKYNYGVLGLCAQLRKLGLLCNKHVPKEYLKGSIKQRTALLQGLLDTDGWVHQDGKWVYFDQCAAREGLVDSVVALVRSLGGSATKRAYTSSCGEEEFPAFGVTIKLPNGIEPFRLSRKSSVYTGSVNTRSAIVDIKPVGTGLARCLTVKNEDGLFVTDDYALTHNSRMVAFRVAWELTKDPTLRILYISATANLAEKQLKFIKDILTSKIYRRYWPDHVNEEEGKRERWTASEISLDHPQRKLEGIRDPSIFTGGLTTSLTGLHCDIAVLDDVVVYENAYTDEGRNKVRSQYSLLSSIEGADSFEWVVGTRYHPNDLYSEMLDMFEEIYDGDGEIISSEPVYEIFERAVEDVGDGTGEFLWPRQQRPDGKWFGFNQAVLAKKRAKYLDKTQFRAQYYNDPNDIGGGAIDRSLFQYYDPKYVNQSGSHWFYRDERLNIVASVDFAYSVGKRSDYTAIVVAGMDSNRNIYVLDIDRFRTDSISDYFDHIFNLYTKWQFRKLTAEVTAAQSAIVKELKSSYIVPNGLALSIAEVKPTRHEGSKEERLSAILEPVYQNNQVWHYRGGNCQVLEDEVIAQFPPHDDVKDSLATAIDHLVPPQIMHHRKGPRAAGNVVSHPRFGGMYAAS